MSFFICSSMVDLPEPDRPAMVKILFQSIPFMNVLFSLPNDVLRDLMLPSRLSVRSFFAISTPSDMCLNSRLGEVVCIIGFFFVVLF